MSALAYLGRVFSWPGLKYPKQGVNEKSGKDPRQVPKYRLMCVFVSRNGLNRWLSGQTENNELREKLIRVCFTLAFRAKIPPQTSFQDLDRGKTSDETSIPAIISSIALK